MTQPTVIEVLHFLRESNNIEDVWDDQSLYDAYLAWDWLTSIQELRTDHVQQAHALLMRNQTTLADDQKGRYRQCTVYIGGRQGVHWELVPGMMNDWCRTTNRLRDWKGCHVDYERIHPFVDGNGRTGRLFMNWQRLRLGLPLLTIRNDEKRDYYRWFTEDS